MKTSQNTILITGGGSGIGFEIARLFSENGNDIIITGRDENRLKEAAAKLKRTTPLTADITREEDVEQLVRVLSNQFPSLNVVINNAGNAFKHYLSLPEAGAWSLASEEMATNYLAVVRLNEKLLPLLTEKEESAIVMVSSIVAFAPSVALPTYSASKAALHSYTQSLRFSLSNTAVKVFELMPPLVNTAFSREIGGEKGIPPSQPAQDLFRAFAENRYEIHTGATAGLYDLSRASQEKALEAMNA